MCCGVKERNRCLKTVKAQEAELSAGQDGLSKFKTELKAANSKNEDLKKSLDEITFQLKRRVSRLKCGCRVRHDMSL